jgi:hypothetical protein
MSSNFYRYIASYTFMEYMNTLTMRQNVCRSVLRRRLRVLTLAVDLARSPRTVYTAVDPAVVITVLMHKIARAAETEGVEEARALLQDWLVILMSAYNRRLERERGIPIAGPAQVWWACCGSVFVGGGCRVCVVCVCVCVCVHILVSMCVRGGGGGKCSPPGLACHPDVIV